jgi:hypothetical protein
VSVTQVPIIDEYYQNVDTAFQVSTLLHRSQFDHLHQRIEDLWHAFRTNLDERQRVRAILNSQFGDKSVLRKMAQYEEALQS